MSPNDLLLTCLAAQAPDEVVARVMATAIFGLTGEVGEEGFGATTLENHLVLFSQPDFYHVAGLPDGLKAVEATARQAAEYARAIGLDGFVINPGTHQRFIGMELWQDLPVPPDEPEVPVFSPLTDVPADLGEAIVAAGENSNVEAVWVGEGPVVACRPHPDPAFLAGLLARDVRLKVYGASLWWSPIFAQEGTAKARATFAALAEPLKAALAADLTAHAIRHRLEELWAFQATFEGQPKTIALAYAPHPHDGFAADFNDLHRRHAMGDQTVPLLSAETLRDVLPAIGTRLL